MTSTGNASANSALPSDDKVFVCWPGKGGRAARTIYRWRKDAAKKLAKALMLVGAQSVWFAGESAATPWNEKEGYQQPNRDLIERAFKAM